MGNLRNISVCWTNDDFYNLDYQKMCGYGRASFKNYSQEIFKDIITIDAYSLPKTMPAFVDKVCAEFDHDIIVPAINRMLPGRGLPPHQDKYEKFITSYQIQNPNKITRYLIFLTDSKPGQFIQIQSNFITDWNAGDYVFWSGYTMHSAYNFSWEDRYILQLTCVDKF